MKKILIALAVVLVVCVAGLLVTAVDQLVGLASRFHPLAGQITFWILVSAIAGGSDTNTSAGHTARRTMFRRQTRGLRSLASLNRAS